MNNYVFYLLKKLIIELFAIYITIFIGASRPDHLLVLIEKRDCDSIQLLTVAMTDVAFLRDGAPFRHIVRLRTIINHLEWQFCLKDFGLHKIKCRSRSGCYFGSIGERLVRSRWRYV